MGMSSVSKPGVAQMLKRRSDDIKLIPGGGSSHGSRGNPSGPQFEEEPKSCRLGDIAHRG